MKNSNPPVSIVIPVYNGSNYLKYAIDSALNQTYKNIEIIVVNDGSDDDGKTEKTALSYGNKIKYFKKENGGVATALNLAIEKAQGEYISWLSHDDAYYPEKTEKQIERLQTFGKDAVVISDYEYIDKNGNLIKKVKMKDGIGDNIKAALALGSCPEESVNGCTLLIPKIFFEKYGYFEPELKYTQDYSLWFKIASSEPFIQMPLCLVKSRQHEEQDSKKGNERLTEEVNNLHRRLIDALTAKEAEDFFVKTGSAMTQPLDAYRNAKYYARTASILKKLTEINFKNGRLSAEFTEYLNKIIFKYPSVDFANAFETALRKLDENHDKIKILFYVHIWQKGGIERVLSIILPRLAKRYTIILAYTDKAEAPNKGFSLPENIIKITINDDHDSNIAERLDYLQAVIKADVFVNTTHINKQILQLYESLKPQKIKAIASMNCNYFINYAINGLESNIAEQNKYLPYADAVTWLTKFYLYLYSASHENGIYMPNPLPFQISGRTKKRGKNILAVGRFDDINKRLDLTLEVFKKVLDRHKDAKLTIVGSYDKNAEFPQRNNQTLNVILKKLAIPEENLCFAGERENVDSFYKNADIFIMTSDTEGLPNVLLEAGCFALPSVLFDIPGLEDVIIEGENGFIIDKYDVEGMAEKISLLFEDEELFQKMSSQTAALASEFAPDKIVKKWTDLIESLVQGGNASDSGKSAKIQCEITPPTQKYPIQTARQFKLNTELILENKLKTLISHKILNVPGISQNLAEFKIRKKDKPIVMFHIFGWQRGGMERALQTLANYLAKKYEVIIAACPPVAKHGFIPDKDVCFLPIPKYLNIISNLEKLINFIKPDVFIGNNNSLPEFFPIYETLKKLNVKTIAYNHESFFYIYSHDYLYKSALKKLDMLKYADLVLWLTRFSFNAYSLYNGNGCYIPNPNTFSAAQKNEHATNTNSIVAVGRFNDYVKRIDRLLKIFKEILKLKPETVLNVVGQYDLRLKYESGRTIESLIESLEIPPDKLKFIGETNDVAKYYMQSDVFIMTSQSEGMPAVVTEAMTYGLPVVIMEIPGLEDLVVNGETGYSVPQDDIKGAAEKVLMLLDDKELRQTISARQQQHIQQFSIDKIGRKWEEIINALIEGKPIQQINDSNLYQNEKFLKNIVKEFEQYAEKIAAIPINELDNLEQEGYLGVPELVNEALRTELENIKKSWQAELTYIKNSWSYKIGRCITKPLSFIYEFIKFRNEAKTVERSSLFNKAWYLKENPDVAESGMNPALHYAQFGWKEGRDPGPDFSSNRYLEERPDVKFAGMCPLFHYEKFGKRNK